MDNMYSSELPSELPLESLSWAYSEGRITYISEEVAQSIGTMTTLTNLELQALQSCYTAPPLQSLPLLQRLVLKESASLPLQLLEPFTFTSLEELHIEDDNPKDARGYPFLQSFYAGRPVADVPLPFRDLHPSNYPRKEIDEPELEELRVLTKCKAVECMSIVLQFPRIRKISGNATLLILGLPSKPPQDWVVSNNDSCSRLFTKL